MAIVYNLIVDNKRIVDKTSKLNINDFYVPHPSSPPPQNNTINIMDSPVKQQLTGSTTQPGGRQRMLSGTDKTKSTPMKRSKWHLGMYFLFIIFIFLKSFNLQSYHLGIRSQSNPYEIMAEVYRAMKKLDFEWKVINPFNVRVRRKNPVTGKYVKMTLQLYQVDFRSYLLDFKSLPTIEEEVKTDTNVSTEVISTNLNSAKQDNKQKDPFENQSQCHHVIEFFEMCASLIKQLASK